MLDLSTPKVVAVLTPRRLVQDIAQARKRMPDVIEYRADLRDGLDADAISGELETIKAKLGLPLLFTLRDKQEGGEFTGSNAKRAHLYTAVVPLVDAIDIEIANVRTLENVPRRVDDHEVTVVLSYHNLTATPGDADLDRLVNAAAVDGADIVKIATICTARQDALRLLSLATHTDTVPIAVVGMGPLGAAVRVVAPAFGSVLGYASLSGATATGQVPVDDLRKAWAILAAGAAATAT